MRHNQASRYLPIPPEDMMIATKILLDKYFELFFFRCPKQQKTIQADEYVQNQHLKGRFEEGFHDLFI